MNKNIIVLILALMTTAIFYQNCAEQKYSFDPLASVQRIPDEICVPGKKLSIFFDDAAKTYIGDVVAYSGNISATANYSYSSASAHPINGPEPVGYELHNFFYEGTDGLTLNFYGNVDASGSSDNEYSLKIVTTNNNNADRVIFVDDPNQAPPSGDHLLLKKIDNSNEYTGYFHYWLNTDGAVIGPFNDDNYEIRVQITSAGDLQGARFYSAGGGSFNLGSSGQMKYIIKYREYEDCSKPL